MGVPPADPGSDFAPSRLTRRSWRMPAGVVVALVGALVAVALLTRGGAAPAGSDRASGLGAAIASVAVQPDSTPAPSSVRVRQLPNTIQCHGLDETHCTTVVRAALAALGDGVPDATTATAWSSLLCDTSIDCPPANLATAEPLGSVIITFADNGPSAWVNVVEHPTATEGAAATEAWIVLWQPASLPVIGPSPSHTPALTPTPASHTPAPST